MNKLKSKLKHWGCVKCPLCSCSLERYSPKKLKNANFLQVCLFCPRCSQAFILPRYLPFLSIFVVSVLHFSVGAWMPVVMLPITTVKPFIFYGDSMFLFVLLALSYIFMLTYMLFFLGLSLVKRSLVSMSAEELNDWMPIRRENYENFWQSYSVLPMWKKLVFIIWVMVVLISLYFLLHITL